MPTFYNPDKGYYLTTNYKVLYSSLSRQENLQIATRIPEILNNSLKSLLPNLTKKHYLLVRNPYDRLESFYKNKFIKDTLQIIDSNEDLKASQKVFLPYLSVDKYAPIEEIRERLLATTFNEVISILPEVYMKDPHLWPQAIKLKQTVRHYVKWNFTFDRILPLENDQTTDFLVNQLGLDLSIHENSTSGQVDVHWEDESREIVNTIYKMDFKQFGYPVIVAEAQHLI